MIRGHRLAPVTAIQAGKDRNPLASPQSAAGSNPAMDGWTVRLGDRRSQRFVVSNIAQPERLPPAPSNHASIGQRAAKFSTWKLPSVSAAKSPARACAWSVSNPC
ncbi:MAG: hypothetical protein QME60_01655 [Verrucomicrobiota bacterium]|nr:hypothetical protein [Verrucomicrobiota bacterium]